MGSIRITDNSQNLVNTNYQAPVSPLSPSVSTSVEQGPSVSTSAASASTKPVVNLFDQSSYQTNPSVTLTDGSTITLPTSTAEDATTYQNLFASVPDDQKEKLNAASANIATAVYAYVQANPVAPSTTSSNSSSSAAAVANTTSSASTSKVGGANAVSKLAVGGVSKAGETITGPSTQASATVADAGVATTYTISQASPDVQGVTSAITAAASTYVAATSTSSGSGGYDSTVQAVAYMGVQGLQQSLGSYASQMQAQIDNENTVRTDQNELSSAVADWPSGTTTQTFTYHDVDANGNLQTYTADLTQDQAKTEASNLTNTLSSMGDDTQMMQMQLQNMEQNYQQGVTTISNIMKMQYDMVKNTIGNIHY
jgi:hypothetical protein